MRLIAEVMLASSSATSTRIRTGQDAGRVRLVLADGADGMVALSASSPRRPGDAQLIRTAAFIGEHGSIALVREAVQPPDQQRLEVQVNARGLAVALATASLLVGCVANLDGRPIGLGGTTPTGPRPSGGRPSGVAWLRAP